MEWMRPFVAPAGRVAYCTTTDAVDLGDLASPMSALALEQPALHAAPSSLRATGAVLTATAAGVTPERFPRRTGLARTRPLT